MSVSTTDLLFGGIRNARIELRNIEAELARRTDQNSENIQTANAFSGSTVTNSLTQSLTEEATGSLDVDQSVNIPPPANPTGGVPTKFLDNFNYLERVATQAEIYNVLGRGRADASQVQRVGQTAFAGGATPDGTMSTAQNTLTQVSTNTQTLDQTNLNFDFSATTGTLPIVVARNREITVTADRSTTEGITNLTQIQGTAPNVSGSAGEREILKSTDPFRTTSDPAALSTDLNDLQGGSGDLQPGVDTIIIAGTTKNGAAISPVTFTYGDTSGGVAEVLSSEELQTDAVSASSDTTLNNLDDNQVDYEDGDLINITGTDADDAAIDEAFTFGDSDDGTTLGDLVTFINTAFPGSTATLSEGKIKLTANDAGEAALALTIADGGETKTDWPTFTEETAGTDGVSGDGTTVGALVSKISSAFPDATATLAGNGHILLTSNTVGAAEFSLSLSDGAGDANRGFASNPFLEDVPGEDSVAGSILPGASFQTARANASMAFNNLTETATSTQKNVVVNTHTVDVRRGNDGEPFVQAALTPRSMDILVQMNRANGDVTRLANIGSAVQAQALVQTAEGGVDQNGTPSEGGGGVMNTASQTASGTDDTSVTHFTQIRV